MLFIGSFSASALIVPLVNCICEFKLACAKVIWLFSCLFLDRLQEGLRPILEVRLARVVIDPF